MDSILIMSRPPYGAPSISHCSARPAALDHCPEQQSCRKGPIRVTKAVEKRRKFTKAGLSLNEHVAFPLSLLTFENYALDVDRRSLERDGRHLALRPQAM